MALKIKAVERLVKFSKEEAGTYRYVMQPELYNSLNQDKVIREAALRSGVSKGVMQAVGTLQARSSKHGRPKVTAWHCQVSEPCDSGFVRRVWKT